MRYMARVFAVLLLAGAFGVPGLSADGGGDYSAPPADERTDEVRLADGGGDRSGPPAEDVHGRVLV